MQFNRSHGLLFLIIHVNLCNDAFKHTVQTEKLQHYIAKI